MFGKQKIEGLEVQLKENGVMVLDDFEYGKFVHIMEDEGNIIKLCRPVDQIHHDQEEPAS